MGEQYEALDGALRGFIEKQHMFFVATAPLDGHGHLNLSPKGLDCLRVLGPRHVAYLDHVGSGAETIAHLRENGRIVLMLCAFEGPPIIVRLHGCGDVVEPQDPDWAALRPRFPEHPSGRAIIRVEVTRISDSCGFGVPEYTFANHRPQLAKWVAHKGEAGLLAYQRKNNDASIDGLPALRWVARTDDSG